MRQLGRGLAAAAAIAFCCAAYLYLTLPDVRALRSSSPATTAFIELRARQARASGQEPRRVQRWVSYARISPHLKRAVLVAEDSAFWQHDGVDYDQLKESMEVNLERGEFVRGASTITQQLAKNLYLSPAKNPIRKLRELLIAQATRGGALEAAHPRAVSERHRVGRRHLWRRGGVAYLLRQARGRSRTARGGAARRRRSSIRAC